MFRLIAVSSCLIIFTLAAQNKSTNSNAIEQIREDVNVSGIVTKAITWLLSERRTDFTWGAFTPRAIVALAMAEDVFPLSVDEWSLMVKQLNIQLSLELGKNGGVKDMGLTRLALFTNALYATCQDPRNFHGFNLIADLRSLTDAAFAKDHQNFSLPAVFLPLCFAGKVTYSDFIQLAIMYRKHEKKADLQALELIAMSCITHQKEYLTHIPSYEDRLEDFTEKFLNFGQYTDVYTKALSLQAINSNGIIVNVSSLVPYQESSGSFGSLLATYHAIPALLGKSLLSLKDRQCGGQSFAGRSMDSPLSESSTAPKVYYSVWIGEGVDRDSHTITISNIANKSLLDVMTIAQTRNPMFKFSVENTHIGKRVFQLAGQPNDVERQLYWSLYKTRDGAKGPDPARLQNQRDINDGVDHIYVLPEDHYTFWFKRGS